MEVTGKKGLKEVETLKCQPCKDNRIMKPSDGFCLQCAEHMCKECFNTHKQFKFTRGHTLADTAEAMVTIEPTDDFEKCAKHMNELIKFYCPEHKQVGCGDCMILDHKACKVEYIRDKARAFKESREFQDLITQTKECLLKAQKTETSIRNNKTQTEDIHNKFVQDVEMFSNDVISKINDLKNAVISESNAVKSKNIETATSLEMENKELMKEILGVTDMLESHTDKPDKFFVNYVLQEPKIKEFQEKQERIEDRNQTKIYQFKPDENIERSVRELKILGSVEELKDEEDEADAKKSLTSTSSTEKERTFAFSTPDGRNVFASRAAKPLLPKPQPLFRYQMICRNIKKDGEYLSYRDNGSRDVGLFVFKNTDAIEIEIISVGERGTITVGAVPRNYPEDHQPGWGRHSIGYHADDGRLYVECGSGTNFSAKCTVGDKMGCRVTSGIKQKVIFTRNRNEVGSRDVMFPERIFLAVGFHSPGEIVKVIL